MADLRAILAQLLGQQEEEQPNLAPRPAVNPPNTRGIFGRRQQDIARMPLGYGDVAPMPPSWAMDIRPRQQEIVSEPPPEPHPFPFPMAGQPPAPASLRSPMPTAARIGVPNPSSPAAYGNFADYANAQLSLRTPEPPVDREPWRQRVDIPVAPLYRPLAVGEAAPRRGLEPPSAPVRREPDPFSLEDEAWQAAIARARQSVAEDRRSIGRRLPRPGNPLIGQAWSDPDRRNRTGGR